MKKAHLAGAILLAAVLASTASPASATPAVAASALAVAEDGAAEGYVDLDITGDGEFSVAPDSLRITTGNGTTLAVASALTQRDPETNQRVREITAPEVVGEGTAMSVRFEFAGASALGDGSHLAVLSDASGHPVASWKIGQGTRY